MLGRLAKGMNKPGVWCAAAIFLITLLPYLQTGGFGFIDFDDYQYVHYSPVAKGLSWANLSWALTDTSTMANWHPLTIVSLMTDVSCFGINAGAMHVVNAALHALAAALLFLFLLQVLGSAAEPGRRAAQACRAPELVAAALAALFWSLHPLRVESVAWISSRKDVLSVLFCLGGLMAHLGDVRRWQGDRARETDWRKLPDDTRAWLGSWRWWVGLGCFALGYMAKPTMMVFPAFVALIEWLETGRVRWRALEVYAAGAVVVLAATMFAQGSGGAIVADYPLFYRALNAAVSVSVYVRQLFLPSGLAVFYPYDANLPPATLLSGVFSVAGLVALAALCWKPRPVVTCGVVWFLGALLPVLGLLQVGWASHADRYTYLSTLGFSLVLAVCLRDLLTRSRLVAWSAAAGAAAVLAALGAGAWRQASVWRDDQTLFNHTLAVSKDNYLASRNLGIFYFGHPHDCAKAAAYFEQAFRASRERNRAFQLYYIMALAEAGVIGRAKEETHELSENKERLVAEAMSRGVAPGSDENTPRLLDTYLASAMIAYCEGDKDLAREHVKTVLDNRRDDECAHYILGLIARDEGHLQEAVKHWKISAGSGIIMYRGFLLPRIAELEKALAAGQTLNK